MGQLPPTTPPSQRQAPYVDTSIDDDVSVVSDMLASSVQRGEASPCGRAVQVGPADISLVTDPLVADGLPGNQSRQGAVAPSGPGGRGSCWVASMELYSRFLVASGRAPELGKTQGGGQ